MLDDYKEDLKVVKKENRKRRKVIEAYQEMMNAGATGVHAVSFPRRVVVAGSVGSVNEPVELVLSIPERVSYLRGLLDYCVLKQWVCPR